MLDLERAERMDALRDSTRLAEFLETLTLVAGAEARSLTVNECTCPELSEVRLAEARLTEVRIVLQLRAPQDLASASSCSKYPTM